jgi:type II secretory pathway pseudopilin PulG
MRQELARLGGDQRGLTLVEVLVAVSIIMIGLVSLLAVMPLSISHIGQANFRTNAVFLAQERIEQVKNAVWTCFPLPYTDAVGVSDPATSAPRASTAVCTPPTPNNVAVNGAVTFADEAYNAIPGYTVYRRQVRVADCGVAPGCGGGLMDSSVRQVTVSVFFRRLTGDGTINSATEDVVKMTTFLALRQ